MKEPGTQKRKAQTKCQRDEKRDMIRGREGREGNWGPGKQGKGIKERPRTQREGETKPEMNRDICRERETAKDRHSEMCRLRQTERHGETQRNTDWDRRTKRSGNSPVRETEMCLRQNKRWRQGGEL